MEVYDFKRYLFNPVNNLIYATYGRSVDTVIVDGKVVVEGQKALYVDEVELCEKVQEIGEGLLSRTGVHFEPRWKVV